MVRLQGCRALCCGSTVTDNAHESTASVLPCTQPTLTERISATETDAYSEGQGTSPYKGRIDGKLDANSAPGRKLPPSRWCSVSARWVSFAAGLPVPGGSFEIQKSLIFSLPPSLPPSLPLIVSHSLLPDLLLCSRTERVCVCAVDSRDQVAAVGRVFLGLHCDVNYIAKRLKLERETRKHPTR